MTNRLRSVAYAVQDIAAGRRRMTRAHSRFGTGGCAASEAELTVGCYANWPDFEDALRYLTPNSSGACNGVAFVPPGKEPTDWIGIFNQPKERVVELVASSNRIFFAIGEPATVTHRPLHQGPAPGSTVFTCDRDLVATSDGSRSYVLTPPMLRTWSVRRTFDQLSAHSVRDKPGRLSWITSDIATLPGHRHRLAFLQRLRKELRFDLYGRGFKRVYDKWDVLAPYRYSIAFENVRAPGYFTEKLMDCFVCETMPIYVGDPQITRCFPEESLVVIDPDSDDVAEQIRAIVESDRWHRNRDAILEAKRRVLNDYNVFSMLSRLICADARPATPPAPMTISSVKLA